MTTPQRPIGSGFGYRTTAAEVLEGIDLGGRLAIVTGGYSGLGLETVRALSGAGAEVIVPARRPEHAAEVLEGIERVRGRRARPRLARQRAGVRRGSVLDDGRGVDILINNAAIMACPETRVGAGLGGAVRHQPPRPLRARQPAVAAAGRRRRRARGRAHLDRPQALRHPLGRPAVRARLREVGGVRAGEDRQLAVRRPARRARPGRRRARVRRASRRDHDAAPAPPLARGDDRRGLDGRGRPRRRSLQDARAGRLDLDLGGDLAAARGDGRRLLRELRHRRSRPSPDSPTARIEGVDAHAIDPDAAARLWAVSAELTGVDAFAAA